MSIGFQNRTEKQGFGVREALGLDDGLTILRSEAGGQNDVVDRGGTDFLLPAIIINVLQESFPIFSADQTTVFLSEFSVFSWACAKSLWW